MWNRDTDEGYLTHRVSDYLSCLKNTDKNKFNELLHEDLQYWKERLELVIKQENEKIK